jgi:tetratricopeptide (TPR) repeat protein
MSRSFPGTVLTLICLLVLFLVSCGVKQMTLNVRRPAEINLKDYKRIAVGDIDGLDRDRAADVADAIVTRLVELDNFDVLDRQHLGMILEEHDLTLSGMIDENTAVEIGKLIGSAALIFGRVRTDHYEEVVSKDNPWTDKKGKTHQTITRTGTHTLTVHFSVIDVQTGKILGVKDISASPNAQTTADNEKPGPVDKDALSVQALNIVGDHFTRFIAPYTVTVAANFETDERFPELDRALAQFRIGETGEALRLLEGVCQKQVTDPRISAKAFYNLGLAQMYAGLYPEAYENLKKAYSVNPTSRYEQALAQLRTEKAAADRLREQED